MPKPAKIIAYCLAVLFCFYLIVGFIILPLSLRWIIAHKGAEVLKHPVSAGPVYFNPLLWQLTIKDIRILDDKKDMLAGFDQLKVDVSFLALLKKTYRVESVYISGLTANVVLLPGGHVNLLDLVPKDGAATPAPAATKAAPAATPAPAAAQQALPLVIVDKVLVEHSQVSFTDTTVEPAFKTRLHEIHINADGFSTLPGSTLKTVLQARWDDKANIESQATIQPFAQPLALDASLNINNYLLTVVTPYTGKYAARTVKDGKLDFNTVYKIAGQKLTASHKLVIQRFGFGDKVESKDALNLPFGLAIALLEDPHGRINISLPVNGDMSDPQFHYMHLVGQVARNFFIKLMTKPFAVLGSVFSSGAETEDLGYVRFKPGVTEITAEEKAKLSTLVKGLWEHPRLLLTVNGAYDADADWKAIKTVSFQREYEALKKESNGSETWTMQHLYQRHFGIRALWAISRTFKTGLGAYNEPGLNEELRQQMILDSPVDKAAVELLAMERAQKVRDYIVTTSGFDKARISIGRPLAVQSSAGLVPLEMELTTAE